MVIPAFRGADKTIPGEGINSKVNPPGVFENNEGYGMNRHGMWAVYMSGDNAVENHPTVLIKDLRLWNTGLVSGVVAYHTANLTFDNLLLLSDANAANRPDAGPLGDEFRSIRELGLVIKNSRIEGYRIGIDAPFADASKQGQPRPTVIQDTTLNNYINIRVQPQLDEIGLAANALELRNVQFKQLTNVPAVTSYYSGPSYNIMMVYRPDAADLTRPSSVKVYDYNGIPDNNFQVFYKEQRPNFVMPQTPL